MSIDTAYVEALREENKRLLADLEQLRKVSKRFYELQTMSGPRGGMWMQTVGWVGYELEQLLESTPALVTKEPCNDRP